MQTQALPKGFRDLPPEQFAKREYLLRTIREVATQFGYFSMETPAIENRSVLENAYGSEEQKLIFGILNSGDFLSEVDITQPSCTVRQSISHKALRYDLTVPLARFIQTYQRELSLPFKRLQIQPVWRADRP